MHAAPLLSPLGDPEDATGYLVRLWVAVERIGEAWRTSEWTLTGARSVEAAIEWAREQADGAPAEVFVIAPDGAPLRVWGGPPPDSVQSIEIGLTSL